MHSPRPTNIEVYLPRVAFERITEHAAEAAAFRLSYGGPLHWESSVEDLPAAVPPDSVRVRCRVTEAKVFLECFRVLVDVASAEQEDELLIAYAEAMGLLMAAIEGLTGRS
jgi:hypothetical protein